MAETMHYTIQISEPQAGARLDKALTAELLLVADGISRARVQACLKDGFVRRQGGAVVTQGSLQVALGEVYEVSLPPPPPSTATPQDIPLDIVYQDDDIMVINKPAGLVVHPAAGNWDGTLVNALLHIEGDGLSDVGEASRPGIVHRLDKETSGLMVVARTPEAHLKLTAQFADHSLSRTYIALVWGVPIERSGTVDQPIGRDLKNRQRMAVTPKGKPSVTHYQVGQVLGQAMVSLIQCELETGRTHQIRVHMGHIGHPLVGDPVYGGRNKRARHLPPEMLEALTTFPRQALHAAALELIHPRTGELCRYEAPVPQDFYELLRKVGYTGEP